MDKRDVLLVSGLQRNSVKCGGSATGYGGQVLRSGMAVVCAVGVEDAGILDAVGVAEQVQGRTEVNRADIYRCWIVA